MRVRVHGDLTCPEVLQQFPCRLGLFYGPLVLKQRLKAEQNAPQRPEPLVALHYDYDGYYEFLHIITTLLITIILITTILVTTLFAIVAVVVISTTTIIDYYFYHHHFSCSCYCN